MRLPIAAAAVAAGLALTASARAQDAGVRDAGGDAEQADAGVEATPVVVAPSIVRRTDAAYPEEALRARVEGNVGLELSVDETGHVTSARVTQAGGPRLRRGALAAAGRGSCSSPRRAAACPSRRRSTSRTSSTCRRRRHRRSQPRRHADHADRRRSIDARARRSARSAPRRRSSVRDRDFQLRPIGSVQDILRVTPGPRDGAALGRRQGEPVLPARLRRRPRHRHRALDRRRADQHGLARARPGLRRHELHHPRGGRARGDHEGPVLREPGRLRDGGRGQPGVARRLRAQLGRLRLRRLAGPRRAGYRALLDRQPQASRHR